MGQFKKKEKVNNKYNLNTNIYIKAIWSASEKMVLVIKLIYELCKLFSDCEIVLWQYNICCAVVSFGEGEFSEFGEYLMNFG